MADFPAQEFRLDGEPGTIRHSARKWLDFGSAATDAAMEIRSLDSSLFIGPEGDLYRDGLSDKLPPHLDITGQAYTKVGTALTSYADALTGLHDRMSPLRGGAPGLWDALQQAKGRVATAESADRQHQQRMETDALTRPADQPPPPDMYHSDLGSATGGLSTAQQAWDDCLTAARAVRTDLRSAVDAADRAIRDAADMRFAHNPSGFGAFVQGFKDFVKDHVEELAKLSSVLRVVSGIAGVLSFIPVIGQAALVVSMVTAGMALAIDASIMFSTGQGSWGAIILDGVLLVAPFGIGKAVKAVRGAPAGRIVRNAYSSTARGNYGLGSATRAQANQAGRMWVGPGNRIASDGKTMISADRLRQYRPPSFKPKLGKTQANFEQRFQPSGPWQSNGHLDIVD